MIHPIKIFLLMGTFALGNLAVAQDAHVLPKGRFRLSFAFGMASGVSEEFDSSGSRVAIVEPYKINLSAKNFQSFDTQVSNLVNVLNSFENYRYDASQTQNGTYGVILSTSSALPTLGDALARGKIDLDGHGDTTQYALSLMYGVTNRFSAGVIVPLVKSTVRLNAGIVGDNTAENFYQFFQSSSGSGSALDDMIAGLDSIRNLTADNFQQVLVERGYSPIGNRDFQGIGDVVLGGRYNYLSYNSEEWMNSIQLGVTLPTGKIHPTSELLAVNLGQGAWDIRGSHILNYTPLHWLKFYQTFNYTHPLPADRKARVRTSPGDFLPDASTEEELTMRLGDKFWISGGLSVSPWKALSFSGTYEWYWKDYDHYAGHRADRDYHYLSEDTDLYLESLTLGMTLSSMPAFFNYDFPMPMDLNLQYVLPVRGKNTPVASLWVAELALYF